MCVYIYIHLVYTNLKAVKKTLKKLYVIYQASAEQAFCKQNTFKELSMAPKQYFEEEVEAKKDHFVDGRARHLIWVFLLSKQWLKPNQTCSSTSCESVRVKIVS